MGFDNQKKVILCKPDKSHKGDIDLAVKPLCDAINSSRNYFTTSSCAGRIVITRECGTHNKSETQWLFVSHQPVSLTTLQSSLHPLPPENLWFREEGMIIHVACRTVNDALELVSVARQAGLKRSGVISSKQKTTVEIVDTEKLELPIAVKGQLVVSEEYLNLILNVANKKLKRTRKKIKRLQEMFIKRVEI